MNILNYIKPLLSKVLSPDWTVYKDVKYGISKSETADLYLLNRGIHPVVVFIHGGGWSSGDKSAYEGRARRYALAGFHVVALNYRLADVNDPTTQWPAQLIDVQLAVRWLRENAEAYRIDPYRIVVGGDSAGAHLALFLGSKEQSQQDFYFGRDGWYSKRSPKALAVLDMFGPTNLNTPEMDGTLAPIREALFGGATRKDNHVLYQSASPINFLTSSSAPTCIIHGNTDTVVPYKQSEDLDKDLTKLGVSHKFITYSGGHDLNNVPWYTQLYLEIKGLWFMLSVTK